MYQRILVPVDGSPTSKAGLATAIRLAFDSDAQLRLVHVVDFSPLVAGFEGSAFAGDVLGVMRRAADEVLQEARGSATASGVAADVALCESPGSAVWSQIVDEAKNWNADLIVLGTHGRRGVRRALLGSDAEQVARHAPVPVLLVRETADAGA